MTWTYFLNAVEMAAFSPAFMSSLEKKPKPVDVAAGFGGLLDSGTLMLLQTEALLPAAPERDTLTSGCPPSGAVGSGLEVFGLVA